MSTKVTDENSFDRVEFILNQLARGSRRDVLAKKLGYTNPKSLDIFMRRKGFMYDREEQNYCPVKNAEIKETKTFDSNKRIGTILSLFARNNYDTKAIAELTGFDDHIELAEFMKSHNYLWNEEIGNYSKLKKNDYSSNPETADDIPDLNEFYMYLPLLRQLYINRDKLSGLLDSNADKQAIHVYQPAGTPAFLTMSIHDSLHEVVKHFSNAYSKKVNEIYEAAVIEFLIKNGYEEEVRKVL